MLASHYSSSRASECSSSDNTLLTRDPIRIFKQINKAEGEKKREFEELLGKLREDLPKGFKIGAAVGKGDCFFDSVAQGLNELRNKDLITNEEKFNVKSLRKSCKQYAQQANQSKKGSWLGNALKREGEKLCEYIPRIEFTAEDIENASSDSEIKILKLENAVWGRSEIEGKMICEKYKVKIKVIELRKEQVDGLNVTKDKVGTGNNIIYIVNYRNHFVPLLSKVEKDINKSVKVSREEAYGNVVGSNSNNISQSYISIPLQDIENSSHKQSSHSRSPGKENRETGRKRGRSVTDKDDRVSKKLRIDVNIIKDSEPPSDLQDEPRQNELHNARQTKQYIPYHLVGLMYRLDLSVLCSLRESMYKSKYPSLSLAFGDSEIDEFSNIVLRYKKKSIHIQIEGVDKYYIDNDISYAKLFIKGRRSFSINSYFNSFVKHIISKPDGSSNSIEHLVIYTNADLGLTEEKKLKQGQSKNFHPFEFSSINIKGCGILKDFLFTNDNTQGRGFYQFSQNKTTREELLKRLEFSPAMQKVIKEREFSQEFEKGIKEAFLDKLVFAVNQPNREELNSIIKNEIKKNSKAQDDYIALQEKILCDLAAPEKDKRFKKSVNYIPGVVYEFNLLLSFLHDMFLHKSIFSINFEGKNHDISNSIALHYKDKVTYVKAHDTNSNIGYSQLFSSKKQEKKNVFSINKYFTLFIEELGRDKDIEYFVIYTNADLDLTEEKKLKKEQSKDFYPLRFDNIDIRRKKYKILRGYSCINEDGLYQFSQEETTRLLSLLKLPPSLQKEKEKGKLSSENEQEIKEKFLDKLIFAVNQLSKEELNSIVKNEIDKSNVLYNYEKLHEIALRWSESHEFGSITKEIMEKLLEDIKNNRSSYQRIQNRDINEEIKFAKSVVGREGIPAFDQFLVFLVKGKGRKCLEVLKREGINLSSMSSILSGAGANATNAFQGLYDLWFDKQGNKTKYLKTLEEKEINLANISSILNKARAESAKAFQNLYDLWFDQDGKKTQYLIKLEENGVDLVRISSILSGAGANAAKAFKDLYDLWFDAEGNKTKYLKTLEKEEINLVNMSSILHRAGTNAAKAFQGLHDLWFDKQGNKTKYLETLEREEINLTNMSSVLAGAGVNAAKAFEQLYNSFFDEQGNIKQHLKHFIEKKDEEKSFTPHNLSSMLSGAGVNAKDAFEKLHNVCFNDEGERTELLNDFYKVGFRASNLSCMLCGARARASSLLKKLHNVCFNERRGKTKLLDDFYKAGFNSSDLCSTLSGAVDSLEKFHNFCFIGETKKYLNHFLREGFTPTDLSRILHGARTNVCSALKDFHDICFGEKGKRTQLLDNFYKKGFRPIDLSNILSLTGNNAIPILRNFHELCFNKENYLNHFLAKKKLFTPQNLSKILEGIGTKICPTFEKLHDFCFDKAGNKTSYLNNLIKNNSLNEIFNILREKVRKAPSTFLDDISLQQQDINIIEESEIDGPSTPSVFSYEKQLTNDRKPIVELCDLSSKVKEKLQKKGSINCLTVLNGTENNPQRGKDNENLEEQESASLSSRKNRINKASASQQQSNLLGKRKLESSIEKQKESTVQNYSKKKKANTRVSSEYSDEERQEVFLRLSEFVLSNFPDASIKSVRQGLHLPSFEKRGTKVNGKCVAITRSLSQALFLHGKKSVLSNLETSAGTYGREAQHKQTSDRKKKEVCALENLLYNFEEQLDSYEDSSLPLSLIYNTKEGRKTFSDLSNYITGIKDDFAIHLVTSNHVVAIYKIGGNYAHFDCNTAFISDLKSVDQLMKVVEKAVKVAGYEVEEKGFFVEHFDVDKANSLLPDEDKQILAKGIKTERQLLEEQDKEFGLIKVNGQELSRVQLYDFGTKIDMEGSIPLLINANMNLSSKKFQDHLNKKEVSMTAREYLDNLKNSKNVEKVIQATKIIPFVGSGREIEEAEQTRKPKQFLLEQSVKGVVNFIANKLTADFFAGVSQPEPEKTPEAHLNDLAVERQLFKNHYTQF